MKATLRLWAILAFLNAGIYRLGAQCELSDVFIQNVAQHGAQLPGTCTVKFDASFIIEDNNGNKYIFLHAWLQSDYPDYFACLNGATIINGAVRSPKKEELDKGSPPVNNNISSFGFD